MSAAPPSDPAPKASNPTPIVISALQRRVLLITGAILLVATIVAAPGALTIFLGGTILALFLRYPLELLERVMPPRAAMSLVLLLLALVIAGAVLLLLPPLIAQLDGFARDLPGIVQWADTRLHDAVARMVDAGVLPSNADVVVRDVQQGILSRARCTDHRGVRHG